MVSGTGFVADHTIYTSPRLLEICGFAPDTIFAGRNDLLARIPFHPEDRPLLIRAFAEHFAGKTARYDVDTRIIRDGETRWVHLTDMAARDRSGAVVRWTGTVQDITERKRAEEALRESEQRYERVVSASDEGFWDWKVEGDKYYLSPRALEIFDFPPGTIFPGRAAFFELLPILPADREALQRAAAEHFAGKTPRMEIEVRASVRGEDRWIQATGLCDTRFRGTGSALERRYPRCDCAQARRRGAARIRAALRARHGCERVGILGLARPHQPILCLAESVRTGWLSARHHVGRQG